MQENQKGEEENYHDRLIREKVEDMERRVATGVLDQESITVNRVHTFIRNASQITRSKVVAWFISYRPHLIEQSKLADIADCIRIMNIGRFAAPNFTVEQIWLFMKDTNPLEISEEEIKNYLASRNDQRAD